MSEPTTVADRNALQKPLPTWLSFGILGLAIGSGLSIAVMHNLGYRRANANPTATAPTGGPSAASGGGGGGGAGGGMPMPQMGMSPGGGAMMGMGMMGGGGGFGGGGGGGASRGKRTLTALVGKLELLSKGLHVELDAEQSAKIAAKLADLEQAEKMTGEEADSHLNALEEILNEEQKAALSAIDLPRGGGPPGAGGGMGGGPMARGTGGGMGGGGAAGGSDDENPFRQEASQKQLRDLLGRLQPSEAKPDGSQ